MSDTLIATFGGLVAMLFWGAGDWLVARSSRKDGAFEVNAAFQIPGLVIISAVALATHQHIQNTHNVLMLCLAGFIFSAAFVLFIKAFAAGSTGLVAPAACTYPLFTILLTAIFLTLAFSHRQVLAMLVIIVGVMMLAYEKRQKSISLHIQHKATILALATAFLWGVGNVIQNTVISKESWEIVLLSIDVSIAFMALLMMLFMAKGGLSQKVARVKANKTAMLAGAIYVLGSFGFYYSSVRVGSVLVPLVVSSTSPLVTSGLGAVFDHERLTLLKRVGAVVAVAGIVLVNLG